MKTAVEKRSPPTTAELIASLHFNPSPDDTPSLPAFRGQGTFSTALEGLTNIDVKKEGYASVMHRPISSVPKEYTHQFSIIDPRQYNFKELLKKLPLRFSGPTGKMKICFDEKSNEIHLQAYGLNAARVRNGLDYLGVFVKLDDAFFCDRLIVNRGMMIENLTRSMLSLLCVENGFSKACPELYELIKIQLVLPKADDFLKRQEVLAYEELDTQRIDETLGSSSPSDAYNDVIKLCYSKCQEVRRLGIRYLDILFRGGHILEEEYVKTREAFFREDLLEDFRFIERTVRDDPHFTRRLFQNVFNEDMSPADCIGDQVRLSYFARGCNKQTYVADWCKPSGKHYRFAFATIRDAVIGQGDFTAEELSEAMRAWQGLCMRGSRDVVQLGDHLWHNDWRRRVMKVLTMRGSPAQQPISNDLLVIAREFVDKATPLNLVLGTDCFNNEQKQAALEAAVEAYWRVWFCSKNKDGLGCFVTTPRAEDIVVWQESDGKVCARIVDMDTLRVDISEQDALKFFARYSYYAPELIERTYERLNSNKA